MTAPLAGLSGGASAHPHGTDAEALLGSARLRLFARMWAIAVLLHLAGNVQLTLAVSAVGALVQVALGIAATATLLAPHRLRFLAVLCALVPVSAWYEAPVVGNHWVLAAALSAVVLLAVVLSRGSGTESVWRAMAAPARVTLLIAYGFAAFSKLNVDFFDPAVSCAVYYHNQLVGSWGLAWLQVEAQDDLARVLAFGAAAVELSVPLLLLAARSRRIGLLLALSFHWLLAMDLAQHFWDFSSVLFAGFLLFLDDSQVAWLRDTSAGVLERVGPALSRTGRRLTVIVAGLIAAAPLLHDAVAKAVILTVIGHLTWWIYGTLVLLLVAAATLRSAPAREGGLLRLPATVLALVPLLVLVNGLTPYLEIKTGFGWNMYSNLRTVAGETNHLLVPATLDLTGAQVDQVQILDSSDATLRRMGEQGYALVFSEFQEYAQQHPEVAVTYRRQGRVHQAARLGDDPAVQGEVSALRQRLQSFRAVDTSDRERCLTAFTPAR